MSLAFFDVGGKYKKLHFRKEDFITELPILAHSIGRMRADSPKSALRALGGVEGGSF